MIDSTATGQVKKMMDSSLTGKSILAQYQSLMDSPTYKIMESYNINGKPKRANLIEKIVKDIKP